MKRLLYLIVIIISGLLQSTLFDLVKVFHLKPDLLLASTVIASLIFDAGWALFFGLFAGVMKDTLGATPFGMNTVLFALLSLGVSKLCRQIDFDGIFARMVLMLAVACVANILTGITLVYLGTNVPFGIFFRTVILGSVYTALSLPLVLKLSAVIYLRS